MKWFTTKKELRRTISDLEMQVETLVSINNELADRAEELLNEFPFDMGQVVYDVQLRSSKGRFTKTKASREHSLINEVVVDTKNYFGLVDRYHSSDVFKTFEAADAYLNSVCVE